MNVLCVQNYVRDQTDNVQSIKLVSETVVALDSLYLNIHHDTMLTVTHIFLTLNEFASGNQATRVELVDRKLIDYVNVILRTHQLQFICADENVSVCVVCVPYRCSFRDINIFMKYVTQRSIRVIGKVILH